MSAPLESTCLWELPETLLYHIARFVTLPTFRAAFLCQSIASLNKAAYRNIILEEEKCADLWDMVLMEDYGVDSSILIERRKRNRPQSSISLSSATTTATATTSSSSSSSSSSLAAALDPPPRRSCKRLRRCPIDQVRDAHKVLKDNTEIAYYYLWELAYSTQKKNTLTRSKLCGILQEYGPNLMYNRVMSSGGNFLVEVCRSKHSTSQSILQCVQELIERRGCQVDIATAESTTSYMTALCVASVRAMPKVVKYLLSKGASTNIQCSGQFRLFIKKTKNLKCIDVTPLEFTKKMLEAELAEGATSHDLKDLKKCISHLSNNNNKNKSIDDNNDNVRV